MDTVKTDCYIQVRKDGRYHLTGSVANATTKKPKVVQKGCVVVKVVLEIPVGAWDPFEASARIVVPPSLVQDAIEVTVEDPK
jgi:hypothetical protein